MGPLKPIGDIKLEPPQVEFEGEIYLDMEYIAEKKECILTKADGQQVTVQEKDFPKIQIVRYYKDIV